MTISDTLSIFESRDIGLNPKFWDGAALRPDVKEQLLQIAYDFASIHYLPKEAIEDITLTGSIANYNWSEHSDVDLHIIVDFDNVDDNAELINDYYRVSKSLWNDQHDIQICGHEVEIYVQDSAETHHSTGVYSIKNGKWITRPRRDGRSKPSNQDVRRKAGAIIAQIDNIEGMLSTGGNNLREKAEQLKNKIKSMRQAGLASNGEFSVENLAFKHLRNHGHLARLAGLRKQLYDDSRSMKNCSVESVSPETILEASHEEATVIQPQDEGFTPDDILKAQQYLSKLRSEKERDLPLADKLDLVMDRTQKAEQLSKYAVREVSQMRHDLARGIENIHTALERLASGQPIQQSEPGSSIFDDE